MKKLADNIDSRTKAYFKKIKENMQYLGAMLVGTAYKRFSTKKLPA